MHFDPFDDQIEGFFICRIKSYTIKCAVREYAIQKFPLFRRILSNIKRVSLLGEFYNSDTLINVITVDTFASFDLFDDRVLFRPPS